MLAISAGKGNSMAQNLKACVVQIQDSNGTVHGTGFIIDANTAVTCAHVVEAASAAPGESLPVVFALTGDTCPAEVLVDAWHPADEDDIAILRLQGELPAGVTPAILGPNDDTAGHQFRAFGYPEVGNIRGVWAEGKILGPIIDSQGTMMLQLRSQEIKEGMSGGPVLDTDGDQVVGMITATYYPPDGASKFHEAAFATPIESISQGLPSLELIPPHPSFPHRPMFGRPFQAPPLPAHFVPRPEVTDSLKALMLSDTPTAPGILVISAIHGLGGIGKSTLAAALAYDPKVQQRFKDGILWATLGQQPDLLSLLSSWIQELRDYDFRPTTVEAASAHLHTLLQDKAVLLVVDDVWEPEHAFPFRVGGSQGRVLITTRRADVAEEVGADLHQMDVMTPDQALDLLSARLGRLLKDEEHQEAVQVAKSVGYLPMALELAAVRVSKGTSWDDLNQALEAEVARLEELESSPRRRRKKGHTHLDATFNLSLNALRREEEQVWEAFVWLGILPEDVRITAPMTSTLWEVSEAEATEILAFLWNDSLLLPGSSLLIKNQEWPAYRLHDLLHDIARHRLTFASPEGLELSLSVANAVFLDHYKRGLHEDKWHTLPDDGYIHTHLTWHMKQADQVKQIHVLLQEETTTGGNGWYQACEQVGQTTQFIADVNLAWRLSERGSHTQDLPYNIGLQCRYALINASLTSLAKNLSPELITELVRTGVWSPVQGLAYIRQMPEQEQQLIALKGLAPYLSESLLRKELVEVQKTGDENWQVEVMAGLAPHLSTQLLKEELVKVQKIKDEDLQQQILVELLPHLPEFLLKEALILARNMKEKRLRVEALIEIISFLPEKKLRDQVIQEALALIEELRSGSDRVWMLAALIPRLPADLKDKALQKALELLETIWYSGDRITAFVKLVPYLTKPFIEELSLLAMGKLHGYIRSWTLEIIALRLVELHDIEQAFKVVHAIGDEHEREDTLKELASRLVEMGYINEALAAAREGGGLIELACKLAELGYLEEALLVVWDTSKYEYRCAEGLAEIALYLTEPLLREVLEEKYKHIDDNQEIVLTGLVPRLAELGYLHEALALTQEMRIKHLRSQALTRLAPHLSSDMKGSILQEALATARAIEDEDSRIETLAKLAPRLAKLDYPNEALAVVHQLRKVNEQANALAELAPYLPPGLQRETIQEALATAQALEDEDSQIETLVKLAPQLAKLGYIEEILMVVHQVKKRVKQVWVWVELAACLPPGLQRETIQEALATARAIKDENFQIETLAMLAPQLTRLGYLDEALAAVRQLKEVDDQAKAFVDLAEYLSPELRSEIIQEALDLVQQITSEYSRVEVLVKLAPQLTRLGYPYEALAAVRQLKEADDRAKVFVDLAEHLSQELRSEIIQEALDLVQQITSEYSRVEMLVKLFPDLPMKFRERTLQDMLTSSNDIEDFANRAKMLARLSPYLPSESRRGALKEAHRRIQKIEIPYYQAEVLVDLAAHLPPELQSEIMQEVLELVYHIEDQFPGTEILKMLIIHAVESDYVEEALTLTYALINDVEKAGGLISLIPKLPLESQIQILEEILMLAKTFKAFDHQLQVIKRVIPHLIALPHPSLFPLWKKLLFIHTQNTREEMLISLRILEPVIVKLGGEQAVCETFWAIQDVGRWWP